MPPSIFRVAEVKCLLRFEKACQETVAFLSAQVSVPPWVIVPETHRWGDCLTITQYSLVDSMDFMSFERSVACQLGFYHTPLFPS